MQFASWPKPAPKPDLGTKAEKKYDVEAFLKGIVKENETRQKRKKNTKKYVATNTHFVRDFLQNLKVQLVKRKLLCETSLKN